MKIKEGDYYTCYRCEKTCFYNKNSIKYPFCRKCKELEEQK